MKKLTVQLKTGGHCIKSAAKNELKRISLIILSSDDDNLPSVLTEQYELLEEFLNNTDFNKLRASDEIYAGIKEGLCTLSRGEDGKPVIRIAG